MNSLKNIIAFILQFGFRSKHSTVHTLISIIESIRAALDESKYVCGITKSYWINCIIMVLVGIMNKWFKSYLQGRKQIVSINRVESDFRELKHGVPQGSSFWDLYNFSST